MSINFNDNFNILTGKPIDSRYYNTDGQYYAGVGQVNLVIPITYRYIGLTVNILGSEYWYANGINDEDLVQKELGGGGTSDEVVLSDDITLVGTEYGMYEDGDTILSGTTIQEVFENMMTKLIPPIYVQPTINLTPNDQQFEIGTYVDFTLDTVFTQNDAGAINRFVLEKEYDSVLGYLVDAATISQYVDTTTDYILEGGDLIYTSKVYYNEGITKDDNLGNPYPIGKIEAGYITDTFTATGVRAYFYGDTTDTSAPTTSAQIRALNGSGLNPQNGTSFTINIAAGSTRVCFAYPANLRDVDSVKYVELGNGEVKDTFTQTIFTVEGANGESGIVYKIYTYIAGVPFGDAATYNVTI